MNDDINRLLQSGITLITSTQRLSRHLRYRYARHQVELGNKAWQTPDCLPWSAWCKRTFDSLVHRDTSRPVLLSPLQQQWYWQDIIQRSSYRERLLQTSATARQAVWAYQLCKQWGIPIFPDGVYLSEDALAFRHWATAYEARKQEGGWLDEASLPDYLAVKMAEHKPDIPQLAL